MPFDDLNVAVGGAIGRTRPVFVPESRFHALARRGRVQLGGGLLIGIGGPVLVHDMLGEAADAALRNATIGGVWALILSFLIFRRLTSFPGVQATAYILPTFVAAFSATALAFVAMEVAFSRLVLFGSFAASVAYFYVVHLYAQAGTRPIMQFVPLGSAAVVSQIKSVQWREVRTPDDVDPKRPVVLDLRAELGPEWERFVARAALKGTRFYNAKHAYESLSGRIMIEHISENAFGSLTPNSIYAAAKRLFDFTTALFALIVLFPVLLVVAVLVRVDSAGPSIFSQQRMGCGGRPFKIYKFRTMRRVAGPKGSEAAMTKDNDPRITRLGRFLRRTRIDELPQMVNILKGEMSWIGPRPEAVELSMLYESALPFYSYRHAVKPGISGWAQVRQGHVTTLDDVDLKLQYDFYYIKNFSLWLDVLVAAKTLGVLLTGHGAK
jgi:lipopolysaccharide/colanic/teichoic acid biosynthesis glycosyltransferase